MRRTLFVSDLHLSRARPGVTRLFLTLLDGPARSAEALYILGDLFDAWVGDDDSAPPAPEVAAALRRYTESGPTVFVMGGNRDFLLGERFAQETGCRLLADPSRIDLHGEPTLLMHGDLLCSDDLAYQAFRLQVRDAAFVSAFLAKPVAERGAIAAEYRRRSGEATSLKPADIMDVTQATVEATLREHGVRRLIHGHTHRPADHDFTLDGAPARRLVLSEWHADRAELLWASPAGIARQPFVG